MEAAWQDVQDADPVIRGRIESEVPVMFADSVPFPTVRKANDILMVELPCGVELDFEQTSDGVRILYVAF